METVRRFARLGLAADAPAMAGKFGAWMNTGIGRLILPVSLAETPSVDAFGRRPARRRDRERHQRAHGTSRDFLH
jgi:hypothetical protein